MGAGSPAYIIDCYADVHFVYLAYLELREDDFCVSLTFEKSFVIHNCEGKMHGASSCHRRSNVISAIAYLLFLSALTGCNYSAPTTGTTGGSASGEIERETPFVRRPLEIDGPDGEWRGNGIAYGPFRDGQAPSTLR